MGLADSEMEATKFLVIGNGKMVMGLSTGCAYVYFVGWECGTIVRRSRYC